MPEQHSSRQHTCKSRINGAGGVSYMHCMKVGLRESGRSEGGGKAGTDAETEGGSYAHHRRQNGNNLAAVLYSSLLRNAAFSLGMVMAISFS